MIFVKVDIAFVGCFFPHQAVVFDVVHHLAKDLRPQAVQQEEDQGRAVKNQPNTDRQNHHGGKGMHHHILITKQRIAPFGHPVLLIGPRRAQTTGEAAQKKAVKVFFVGRRAVIHAGAAIVMMILDVIDYVLQIENAAQLNLRQYPQGSLTMEQLVPGAGADQAGAYGQGEEQTGHLDQVRRGVVDMVQDQEDEHRLQCAVDDQWRIRIAAPAS